MNKPFIKAGYIGILLIVISAALIAVNPVKAGKLPSGFFNPVVAFEFISSESEVYELFGYEADDMQQNLADSIRLGTYIDFVYMIVYTLFLLVFSGLCRRITGSHWFIFTGIIAWCIFFSDFGENMQLLYIMGKLKSGDFSSELYMLNLLTWAKWGGLSALFISLIPFLRNSGTLGRSIAVVSLLSAITGAAAFINRSVLNEIFVLSIALIFILLIVFSFTYKSEVMPGK